MVQPTPVTSTSLTPVAPVAPRRVPTWEELGQRFGSPEFVEEARQSGLDPLELEDMGREKAAVFQAEDAWDAGLSLQEIQDTYKEAFEIQEAGSIGPAPKPSIWGGIKEAWRGADLGADPMTLPAERTIKGKLASAAMMPFRTAGSAALDALKANEEVSSGLAGAGASMLSEKFPNIPAAIPAALATGASEAGNLINYIVPGGAGRLAEPGAGKLANKVAERMVAPGAAGATLRGLERILPPMYKPTDVGELAQLGLSGAQKVGQIAKGGAKLVNAAGELARGTSQLAEPSYFEDAIATVNKQIPDWRGFGRDTRMNDLAEVVGQEKAATSEAANVEMRAERRRIELMKRKGMDWKQIQATLQAEKAAKAAEPTVFHHPWEQAEKTAKELMASGDPELRAHGKGLQETLDSAKLGNVDSATVDEVFGIGPTGPVPGLREESRTFRKFDNLDGEKNTLANSVKYFAGRFLADPSSVIPRMAHEAGRIFDKYNRTKYAFYDGVRTAFEGLDKTERQTVAIMLDTKPADWGPLENMINEKVLASYKQTREVLNRLADVEGLKRQERIGDYFPHIGLHESQVKNGKGIVLPEDGLAAWATPAQSWLPRQTEDTSGLIHELIAKKSALGEAFDPEHLLAIRINAGLRKAYFNPMMKIWEPRLAGMSEGGKAYAEAYMNKLLGRPGKIWEGIDKALSKVPWGNRTLSAHDLNRWQLGLTMNYYRGLLGLAFDTSFKNLGQAQNTIAEYGFRKTGKAAGRLFIETFLTPDARKVFSNSGVIDDYEHIVAGSADMLSRNKALKAMDKILFMPMKFSEYLNRGTAFHAGLAQAYEQGLRGNRALEFAKTAVDKTQFRYGVTNTSPYLQNPFGKLWYQFSSYPMKEVELINEIMRDPDKRKLYRLLLFHGAVLGTGAATGVNLRNAMGYTNVPIPGTGDAEMGEKPKTVPLPLGILPHLGVFTAPPMRLVGDTVGKVLGGEGPKGRDVVNDVANLLPARRYLEKVRQVVLKLDSGMSTPPPRLEDQVMSVYRGKGVKPYLPGGPKAESYGKTEAAAELLGVLEKE